MLIRCDDGGGADGDGDGGVGEASSSSFDVMVEMASLAISVISLFLRLLYIGATICFSYINLKVHIF